MVVTKSIEISQEVGIGYYNRCIYKVKDNNTKNCEAIPDLRSALKLNLQMINFASTDVDLGKLKEHGCYYKCLFSETNANYNNKNEPKNIS